MLENRSIVIVGGSFGIGLKLSQQLIAEGAKVTIGSRSLTKLNKAKNSLNDKVNICEVDASNEQSVESFFSTIGEFDSLVVTIKPDYLICDFKSSKLSDVRPAFESKFWGQYNLVH